MAYREGDRCQMTLLPTVIEEYVAQNDPVRAYDAIIEAMDTDKLGLVIDRNQVGNPAYDPKTMLKLLVYGYSYGWHSSRKLERACHHNLSFIWLIFEANSVSEIKSILFSTMAGLTFPSFAKTKYLSKRLRL